MPSEISQVLTGAARDPETAAPPPEQMRNEAAGAAVRFYGRIILMQFVLLFGGLLAMGLGNTVPAIMLIVIKSMIDLLLHIGGGIKP